MKSHQLMEENETSNTYVDLMKNRSSLLLASKFEHDDELDSSAKRLRKTSMKKLR